MSQKFFSVCLISRHLWSARSTDLTSPVYFLWSHLKVQVYKNNSRTLDQLKNNTGMEIAKSNGATVHRVCTNMLRRSKLCLMGDTFNICCNCVIRTLICNCNLIWKIRTFNFWSHDFWELLHFHSYAYSVIRKLLWLSHNVNKTRGCAMLFSQSMGRP
jgi:hypothetical protein